MKWPSMAVPPIPGAWGRSSACACIMASPSGLSRPPNPGAMAWSKGSITTTNRNSSTGCPCRPKQHCGTGALTFEHQHNSRYRYSHLKGKTPLTTLAQSGHKPLRLPSQTSEPSQAIMLFIFNRLIRSDCQLNIFSERFPVSPTLQYEYVVATIDVTEQTLKPIP